MSWCRCKRRRRIPHTSATASWATCSHPPSRTSRRCRSAFRRGGRSERTWGHLVTPSYFSTLGVHPSLGRFFDRADEQPGQAPAVVVSYRFWQEHLGSDRGRHWKIAAHQRVSVVHHRRGAEGVSGRIAGAVRGGPLAAGDGGRAPGAGAGGQRAGTPGPDHVSGGRALAAGRHRGRARKRNWMPSRSKCSSPTARRAGTRKGAACCC